MGAHVNVLCGFDDAYAPHFATMIASLFAASREAGRVKIHLIASLLSPAVRDRLDRLVARYKSGGIRWLDVDCSPFADAPVAMHFTRAAYARIAAFDVARMERLLYLDVDLLCLADVAALHAADLGGRALGAALDPGSTFGAGEHAGLLGMPPGACWFNSGVLVVDTAQWQAEGLTAACVDFLRQKRESILWVDQDVLNGVLVGRWQKLSSAWNVQSHFGKPVFRARLAATMPGELDVIRAPRIVHFNDPAKPWHFGYRHPYREKYFHHLARSGWPHRVEPVTRHGVQDRTVRFELAA